MWTPSASSPTAALAYSVGDDRSTAVHVYALIINLAVVVYLLRAKRLFGLRGGGAAERTERERDLGWAAVERNSAVPALVEAPRARGSLA